MDEPLFKRNVQAFANGRPSTVPGLRLGRKRVLRSAFIGACVVIAAAGWCAAMHVSADMLDACAVMALMETSNQRDTHARPLVSHDPHFIELTPMGLELIATQSRQAGKFAHIDEYDYRNADGDALVLLIAPAPFASEEPHWSAQRIGTIRLLTWTTSGERHVLAGRADTHGLMRAADALTLSAGR
jgi:hypothetical protein